MYVISAMLNLQSSYLEDERASRMFQEMDNKIQSMALVHEKLYQSQNLSSIDLKEYIRDLTRLLMRSYDVVPDKISLNLDLESVLVLIDTAVPCGLILNEVLSNTFKHAFPGDRTG
jgi:two-component sensor histidine kinase